MCVRMYIRLLVCMFVWCDVLYVCLSGIEYCMFVWYDVCMFVWYRVLYVCLSGMMYVCLCRRIR